MTEPRDQEPEDATGVEDGEFEDGQFEDGQFEDGQFEEVPLEDAAGSGAGRTPAGPSGGADGPGESDEPDEGEQIPVIEVTIPASGAPSRPGGDWTRTEPVRDDPGAMGEEVRKLLGAVRDQFVDPLLRNYPEAAGHLSSAGSEIAAALRALVRGAERQWTDHGEERPDEGRDSQQDQ